MSVRVGAGILAPLGQAAQAGLACVLADGGWYVGTGYGPWSALILGPALGLFWVTRVG